MTSARRPGAGRKLKYDTPTKKKTITMPEGLIVDLADLAAVNGQTFSGLLAHLGTTALDEPKKFGITPIPPIESIQRKPEKDS